MRVLRNVGVKIEDCDAVQTHHSDRAVLQLQLAGAQALSDQSQREHDSHKAEDRPVTRAQRPRAGHCSETAEIGMDADQWCIR